MDSKKQLEELRDQFRKIADNIEQIIDICNREEAGEDVTEEYEAAMGRYLMSMMKMQALSK